MLDQCKAVLRFAEGRGFKPIFSMTRQEGKQIALSIIKRVRLLQINKDEKLQIYAGLIEGLAMSTSFDEDDFRGLDALMNEALTKHKEQAKNAPKVYDRKMPKMISN